ncbi:centrosomal protein of 170 kDa protein B isoform X2 [Gadus morhua]|uniref:centrosomal protein of 170 kDa protein B isoform X2 n=1 Tax=Gadus morhua TaxID=8049 RepID=UPI0011B79B6F|nr:centrosomal protein of 170 kDa protein B-like isoform X2 [Gadus morhua]
MSVTSWFLVSSSGTRHRLPREMIFVGRDDCELMLQSRSVDKQHAVINYDSNTDEHMVKDLGSLNGTFVNDLRIPEQTYITLKLSDLVRFGYDDHVYILERSQHKVPEEALKHEKYTSQLQLGLKALEARRKEKPQPQKHKDTSNGTPLERVERKAYSATATSDSPISKPTPLYGQPSWWGEDEDPDNKPENSGGKQPDQESTEPAIRDLPREGVNGSLSESTGKAAYAYRREPSYFEIPTRESQQRTAKTPEEGVVQEVPTKDTPDPALTPCDPSTPTPPVVQSHASFTIEFDQGTPGKIKIKDHITKFSLRQQRKFPPKEAAAPSEVVSSESKVADWLVQSNVSMMMRRRSHTEDDYSTQSDQSLQKTTKGHRHNDGTLSDSERPSSIANDLNQAQALIPQKGSPPQRSSPNRIAPPRPDDPLASAGSHSPPTPGESCPHQPDLNDNLTKKRSSKSVVHDAPPAEASATPGNTRRAERQAPSAAAGPPVSERYTVPLKNHNAATGFVRAGSLRREKTEYRISTSFSSRSASSASVRPFASVGRRSKLAQDYNAEFLKRSAATAAVANGEKPPSGSTRDRPPGTEAPPDSPPWSRAGTPAAPEPHLVQASSPIHQPVPLVAPRMSRAPRGAEDKPAPRAAPRAEEEDNLSDAGTYTIEDEAQDKEVEEARSLIDQVFGVLESPEQSQSTEADTSAACRPDSIECVEQRRQSSSEVLRPYPEQGEGLGQRAPVSQAAPKWMSRWASLADSYTESQPSPGDSPALTQQPGGGGVPTFPDTTLHNESGGSSTRRALPKAPLSESGDAPDPSGRVRYAMQSTFEVVDPGSGSGMQPPGSAPDPRDDLEPDSLSDASRSDDGSVVETRPAPSTPDAAPRSDGVDSPRLPAKSTSFYVGSEEDSGPCTPKAERKPNPRLFSTATLTKQRGSLDAGKLKPNASAPLLDRGRSPSPGSPESRHSASAALIRQESFTKECPSNTRLPHISTKPEDGSPRALHQDTHSYLKDTEDLLASMEAKLHAFQPSVAKPPSAMDSLSGESDIDTSSTVSHHSNKPNSSAAPANGIHRERSSASTASQDSNRLSSASEQLSERRHARGRDVSSGRTERGSVARRRSVSRGGSMDLSDDAQGSSLPYSDQEGGSRHHPGRKYTVPLKKEDGGGKGSQALSRSSSLSAPRATRASMLRRARLGDASDNEASETDRLAKEAASKQSKEAKRLTRLDMLAMPRKRTSSFNAPSDTEASVLPPVSSRSTGFSNRSTESSSGSTRKASVSGPKPAPQKGALTRTPITRGRPSSAKYTSSTASSRRRQMGCDYASTSEDECDFKDASPAKHTHNRSQPSPARNSSVTRARSRPPPQAMVALRPKRPGRDSEEESQEGEALHSWSNHSAEIARLSQDLAKDLAILAREIHDVAGEGEPPSSATEAQVPDATMTAHEEVPRTASKTPARHPASAPDSFCIALSPRYSLKGLVKHIPEAGLNHQRGPPSPTTPKHLDQNTGDHKHNNTNRPRNREEDIADQLMLNPVTQISLVIRQNTDQLTEKLKVRFQDRMDLWEEVEAKLTRDNHIPVVKSSNKEVASILNELRRVQRQLEVINTIMEPSRRPEQDKSSARPTAAARSSRADPRDWRTTHSASHRGGGNRPGESVRRTAVTPDDARDGYVV